MCKLVNLWCGGTQGCELVVVRQGFACGVKIVFTFGVRKVIRLESNVAQTCTFHWHSAKLIILLHLLQGWFLVVNAAGICVLLDYPEMLHSFPLKPEFCCAVIMDWYQCLYWLCCLAYCCVAVWTVQVLGEVLVKVLLLSGSSCGVTVQVLVLLG